MVADPFASIARQIENAPTQHRHRMRQMLTRIRRVAKQNKPHDRNLHRLERDLKRAQQTLEKRQQHKPAPDFDRDDLRTLPILEKRQDIATAIAENQVVIICGETGSGKTTQLPKIALDLGRGISGMIGHTQPRRIAARALATRIAEELNTPLGQHVGYQIRFTDQTSDDTFIKVMTDGILLNEVRHDPNLSRYDTIILDEAHERSLNIDLLLGLLKRTLRRRDDLKLIITSATIDPESFSRFFDDAPVLNVSGRTYPVEVWYQPPTDEQGDGERDDDGAALLDEDVMQAGIREAVERLNSHDREKRRSPGDVLVFLPTERDIFETAKRLRGSVGSGTEVLPLYARLTPKQQQAIFQPHQKRRIVLATNVAETSLTVPGIRYVIDTGLARISRYSARSKVQRLPIEPISQASANQRKGRCGRQEAGVCIRLYSENDFAQRDEFTQPEIQRSNLAAVLLRMIAMGLGDVTDFAFIDPPKSAMMTDAWRTLHELGAVTDDGKLTKVGKQLEALPIDPRLSRMLIAGHEAGCLAEVLIIASALETQDPRVRPPEQPGQADEKHSQFTDERSDFLSLLRLWDFYHNLKSKLSHRKLAIACRENFLSSVRLREWTQLHRQLTTLLKEHDMSPGRRGDQNDEGLVTKVHQALLTGLLSHVAMRAGAYEYDGAGGKKLVLWPGSGQFQKKPNWIMSAEQVETSQRFARGVAPINPKWIESVGEHLVSRSYSEPHWDRKSARVMAFEKVTLYGLPINPRKRTGYGRIDPTRCRQLFINHALVEQEFDTDASFFRHNAQVIQEVRELEAKTRRHDLLIDPQVIYSFYDHRLPAFVIDGMSLEKWRKEEEKYNEKLLYMRREDLLQREASEITKQSYPDHLEVAGTQLKLEYHLEPGDDRDGVTLITPLSVLNQLEQRRLAWLVPGLLAEKVTVMIRSLPKTVRKRFVPAPDVAEQVVAALDYGKGVLSVEVARELSKRGDIPLSSSDFGSEKQGDFEWPAHLRMNVRVIDEQGKTLKEGRALDELRQALKPQLVATIEQQVERDQTADSSGSRWRQTGRKQWDFGDLPESITLEQAEWSVMAYPALIDEGDTVGVRLFDSYDDAQTAHERGVTRLYALLCSSELYHRLDRSGGSEPLALKYATLGTREALQRQLVTLIAESAFVRGHKIPRKQAEFERGLDLGWSRLGDVTEVVTELTHRIVDRYHAAAVALRQLEGHAIYRAAREDIEQQIAAMTRGDFLVNMRSEFRVHLPRYFQAVEIRINKLTNGGVEKDQRWMREFAVMLQAFAKVMKHQQSRPGGVSESLQRFRWLLEEYRVSLFAQSLGTSQPISASRLSKLLKTIEESE